LDLGKGREPWMPFYCKTDAEEFYSKRKEALFWLCRFGKAFDRVSREVKSKMGNA